MIFGKNIAALIAALLLASTIFGQNPLDATPPENVNGAVFFNDAGKIARVNGWLWDKTNSRLQYNRALGAGTYNLDVNGDFGAAGQAWFTGGMFLTTTFLPASAGSNLLATNSAGGVYKASLTGLELDASGNLKLAQQSATTGQVMKWNGSVWAPGTDDTGGGGSSFYQTLRLNGSAQTQRGKLNFIPSAQITWGLTDDSGNDETEVTATLAQNGATTGQVLKWNGTAWVPDNAGAAGAGGSDTQVQYNSGGSLAGDAGFIRAAGATTGAALTVQGNSISSGVVADFSSTSTAATGNTQGGVKSVLSGANSNSAQTTRAGWFENTHTGTNAVNVGGYFNASGGTDNYSILLGPDVTQYIYGLRRTSDAGGSDLRIQAGGSFSGGSNRAGGNLVLSGGISTGSTGSEIQFLTATNSGSGTADRNPTQKMVLNRSGFLGLNMTSPSYLFDAQNGQYRFCLGATSYTPASVATVSIQNTSSSFAYTETRNSSTACRIGTNSTYAGALAADGAGGFAFYTSTGPNPGAVYRRMLVRDDGGQPRAFLGGTTTAEGAETYVSSGLYSVTTTATVASTTTETTLLGSVNGTKTLPTNLFTAGKKVTVRVTGTIGSTASAPTLNVRLKFGSTTIAETGAQTIGTDIDGTRRFVAEFEVTCRSTGASGTLQAGGEFRYFETATAQKFWECAENLVSSFNTTTTHVVDVTATWNTNDANNTIAGTQATLIIED